MHHQLTTRESRFIAVGLFVGLLVALCAMIVMPLLKSMQMHHSRVDDLQFQLEKYQRVAAQKPELEAYLVSIKKPQQGQLVYQGKNPSVVAAAIQSSVRQAVESSNGNLISSQVLPEKNDELIRRVAVSVRLTGNEEVLQRLLASIESAKPRLVVEKMVIAFNRRAKAKHSESGTEPLNISLEVASYLQQQSG